MCLPAKRIIAISIGLLKKFGAKNTQQLRVVSIYGKPNATNQQTYLKDQPIFYDYCSLQKSKITS